jgi:hypothetical protein
MGGFYIVIPFIAHQKNLNPLGGIGFLLGFIFHL